MSLLPFTPGDTTKQFSATDTSATIAVAGGSAVLIQNVGAKPAYVKLGTGTLAATAPTGSPSTSSFPVMPGFGYQLTIPQGADKLAAVCASSETTTLHVTTGYGV